MVTVSFFKGSFNTNKIYAMQGSYSKFQCQKNCSNKTFDNKEMIEKMLAGFDSETLKSVKKIYQDVLTVVVCYVRICVLMGISLRVIM